MTPRSRRNSIRAKLIGIAMATMGFAVLLMSLGMATYEVISSRTQVAREVATVAQIIGANSTAALTFNDPAAAAEVLSALSLQTDILQGCLYDERGRLFSAYRHPEAPAPCPEAPQADGAQFRGMLLAHSGAVLLRDQRVGTLTLFATLNESNRRLKVFSVVLLVVLVCAVLAALLLSARLQGVVSKPILELAGTASRISELQDFSLRAPLRSEDETGLAIGAFNQMLDRVQAADHALREANARSHQQAQYLTSILDNMGEGMVACDQQGNFLLWNPAATRLVGERAKVERANWARHYGLFYEDGKTLVTMEDLPLSRALAGEAVTDRELIVHSAAEATDRWIAVTTRPLRDDQGQVSGAIALFRDITERKRTEARLRNSEAQLRQAQKMEAIGRLAGGVAHDFNNLLTIIYGNTEYMLTRLPAEHPLRPELEDVLKSAERAAALTRQLLTFSRKQVLEAKPLDLNLVLRALQNMLVRVIGENIELVFQPATDLGLIRADAGQLEQVILNLVVNARDAMPQGGRLTLATSNVSLDQEYANEHPGVAPGPYVSLRVTDTGVGMDAQTLSHIFEPFFTTKERGKGTGLGLSIVFGITQHSGGSITVSSEVGRGTTFTLYLPRLAEAAGVSAETTVPSQAPGGSETILLVEDEDGVRALVDKRLRALGYRVLVATDGVDALEVLQRHQGPIQLVVSDVVMPRMGGPELVRRLDALVPDLRVLFISGFTAEGFSPAELQGVRSGFLQKPFSADALALKVREVLDRVHERVEPK